MLKEGDTPIAYWNAFKNGQEITDSLNNQNQIKYLTIFLKNYRKLIENYYYYYEDTSGTKNMALAAKSKIAKQIGRSKYKPREYFYQFFNLNFHFKSL